MLKHVLVIPDGAADKNRDRGCSPLAAAQTPAMDYVAREGVCGLMQTLYPDLPRESMVAQLGMLGWNPRVYYPGGRASAELLACNGIPTGPGDVALRANFVRMDKSVLVSYNAENITTVEAKPLVEMLAARLGTRFPDLALHHNSDFRNTLVFRNAGIRPQLLECPEPHENHGRCFDLTRFVTGASDKARRVAERLNEYLAEAAIVLSDERANAILPWSPSSAFRLPPFSEVSGFPVKIAIVGFIDFLIGIARAGDIDCFRVGNGRPDTDYGAKGRAVLEFLESDYSAVVCHINGSDEASHMRDLDGKIQTLESIDRYIVGPVLEYFQEHQDVLGSVMIVPDHYSNIVTQEESGKRSNIHSLDPVPFALWNNRDRDGCTAFHEDAAKLGRYAEPPVNHLDLLPLLFGLLSDRRSTRRAMLQTSERSASFIPYPTI